jgi:hypothetical protein
MGEGYAESAIRIQLRWPNNSTFLANESLQSCLSTREQPLRIIIPTKNKTKINDFCFFIDGSSNHFSPPSLRNIF